MKNNEELKLQNTSEEFVYEDIDADTEDELKYEDPLDWLHEHRRRVSERYPTTKAMFMYLEHFAAKDEFAALLRKKAAEKEQQQQEVLVKSE